MPRKQKIWKAKKTRNNIFLRSELLPSHFGVRGLLFWGKKKREKADCRKQIHLTIPYGRHGGTSVMGQHSLKLAWTPTTARLRAHPVTATWWS